MDRKPDHSTAKQHQQETELFQLVKERILPRVIKPARYLGNEWNSIHKDWDQVKLRMVFCFPDVYEVGMSFLGLHLLYGLVNLEEDLLMERVFAPWVDMENLLRQQGIPLFSLETGHPLDEFDVIGFTLQSELTYTNLLNILDLGRIPVRSADRQQHHPLVIAGGPNAVNPEPLAEYLDLVVIGDAEETLVPLLRVLQHYRGRRQDALRAAAQLPGIYVPAYYQVRYHSDGPVESVQPLEPAIPERVRKQVVKDLNEVFFPTRPLVPSIEVVHDRVMLEVMRGCTRSCRFCQAGIIYRPVRERKPELLLRYAAEALAATGHHELSLTSLSTADYSCILPTVEQLLANHAASNTSISLPSLRVDAFSVDLARQLQRVRKGGLTFAPEAGTQRLRDVINKNVNADELLAATAAAFEAGWRQIKLYFMIGLPTETEEDIKGIVRLGQSVLETARKTMGGNQRSAKVTLSISNFIPKAHTPFQWEAMNSVELFTQKQQMLRSLVASQRGLNLRYHDAYQSLLEAVIALGDRRVGAALYHAWALGSRFDSWSEHFQWQRWLTAMEAAGIDPDFYAYRGRPYAEVLPWDHIDVGLHRRFLVREHQAALQGELTGDCRWDQCTGCGVCPRLDVDLDLRGEWLNAAPQD